MSNLLDGDLDSFPAFSTGPMGGAMALPVGGSGFDALAPPQHHQDPVVVKKDDDAETTEDDGDDDDDDALDLPGAEDRPERQAPVVEKKQKEEDEEAKEVQAETNVPASAPQVSIVANDEVAVTEERVEAPDSAPPAQRTGGATAGLSLPAGMDDDTLARRMFDLFQGASEETLDSFTAQFDHKLQGGTVLGPAVANPSEGAVATTYSPFFAQEGAVGDTAITTRTTTVDVKLGVQQAESSAAAGESALDAEGRLILENQGAVGGKKKNTVPLVTSTPSASKTIIADDIDDLECEELDFDNADIIVAQDPSTPGGGGRHTPGVSVLLVDDALAKEVMSSVQFDNFTDLTAEEDEEEAEGYTKGLNTEAPTAGGGGGGRGAMVPADGNTTAQDDLWNADRCQVELDPDTATSGQKLPAAAGGGTPPTASKIVELKEDDDRHQTGESIFKGDGGPVEEHEMVDAGGTLEGVEPFALDTEFDYDTTENIRGKNWDRMAEFKA